MASCLGIYVEDDLIKYAKVRKEKDLIKVEAFNIEFYEDLGEAIKKVINETYSYKIPVCINISNEMYNYFDVFSMLNKNDIKKSVDIEFEMICNERKINKNTLETRYILMRTKENQEKYKVLHIAAHKTDINKKIQYLNTSKIHSMTPISTSITNLLDIKEKDNIAIINIEDETQITTIVEGQIYSIETIKEGMGKILEKIDKTENSIKKAYEVCKNITIYTQETQGLNTEENEHLEDVMPTLYKIATECKKIIDNSFVNINKVYITGLGTAINNIDLYFQEYMINVKCEILKPFFLESSSVKISIKEYIEVNSAIALALDGLGYLKKELNFLNGRTVAGITGIPDPKQINFRSIVTDTLDIGEKLMLRGCFALLIIILAFIWSSNRIDKQMEDKRVEIAEAASKTSAQLNLMNADLEKINAKTNFYTNAIDSYYSLSESQDNTAKTRIVEKDSIPNLLNGIMFAIPQKVKINSIRNSQNTHIVIEAQAEQYEQLGYFTAVLKTQGILTNVKSTSGSRNGANVHVTIEGDLP